MDLDFDATLAFIEQGERFLLTTHINSDADGIGSIMALKRLLGQLGKEAHIGLPDPPSGQCEFLADWSDVRHIDELAGKNFTHAIVTDSPGLDRIGTAQKHLTDLPILAIDHHKSRAPFGQVNLVTTEVSSTCEMVYHLAQAGGWSIDPETAAALYTGIIFDTGSFRFSLTKPTTFEVAAALTRLDIRLDRLADQLFGNKSYGSVKQLGTAIDSLALYHDERVAIMHLNAEAMQAGDPDEVVNYGLLIKGVQVAVLLKEQEAGRYRISLRSQESVDVNAIAGTFDGGGHARAAGCRLQGGRDEVTKKLLAEIGRNLS
ncbi:MAG: DHH family phosphoesterase [Candidatus Latescibacterota bacterium]|mgnify:CR=1 FL=1